jgi:hypothetical protein
MVVAAAKLICDGIQLSRGNKESEELETKSCEK